MDRRLSIKAERQKAAFGWLFVVLCAAVLTHAERICEAWYTVHDSTLDGATIVLPDSVVALARDLVICSTSVVESSMVTGDAPSIFFIIDHSSSMTDTTGSWPDVKPPQDVMGSRFNVTRDLLDTIARYFPSAEIGIAVFYDSLYFDQNNDPYGIFKQLSPAGNGSYIPLTRLDASLGGGMTGLDALKGIMQTETDNNGKNDFVDLVYTPTFYNGSDRRNTNINVAFAAAKEAFASATYPAKDQYVIFLSDGDGTFASPWIAPDSYRTEVGTGIPAIFTVFFSKEGTVLDNLRIMTNNARSSTYSTNNPRSNLWTLETDYNVLMSFLMENVILTLLHEEVTVASPKRLIINGTYTSTTYADSFFTFNSRIPLEGEYTHFTFDITYDLIAGGSVVGESRDTVEFDIQRADVSGMPFGWYLNCWDRTLAFFYNGQPVASVNDTMGQLEMRFTTDNADGEYSSVSVTVTHSTGAQRDSVFLSLSGTGGVMTNTFNRVSGSAITAGDNTLQHSGADNIIGIFQNPNLPLDMIRVSVPYSDIPKVVLSSAITRDNNGNGYLDAIELTFNGNVTFPSGFNLNNITIEYEGAQLSVRQIEPATGTNSATFTLLLNEDNTKGFQTDWLPLLTIIGLDYTVAEIEDFPCEDGAGPVVESVIYYPGESRYIGDTLRITFSEPVNRNELTVTNGSSIDVTFNYYKAVEGDPPSIEISGEILDNARYIEIGGNEYITEITVVTNVPADGKYEIVPFLDSLQLVYGTTDQAGNSPPGASTSRRSRIEIGGQNVVTVVANPNPFVIGAPIPDIIHDYYRGVTSQQFGTIIAIISKKPLMQKSDGSYGSAVIYDAVGNLIKEDLLVMRANETTYRDYGIHWDGTNENGRNVGFGSYLFIVKGKDIDGSDVIQKIVVGVKLE